MSTTWLVAALVIVIIMLAVAAAYLFKFSMMLLRVQDGLESALDVLDVRYASISKVLEIPLFYDSPEIRRVVNEMKDCRDAILVAANYIADADEGGTDEGTEENS